MIATHEPLPRNWVERAFPFVFLGLLGCSIVPLWVSRFLPMVDLPQHLSIMRIQEHLGDSPFQRYFMERPGFTPYGGYYWVVRQLAHALPLEIANRVFLSACAVGLPIATLCLARALDRSRWLALFAIPLAYDFSFSLGFVNYSASLVLFMFGLAAYAARLRGRIRGWRWDLVLVLVPVACVATHALPYLLFLASLGVLAVALETDRATTLLRLVPSLALLAWWLVPTLLSGVDSRAMGGIPPPRSLAEHLPKLPDHLFDWFRGSGGFWIFVCYAILLGATAVAGWRRIRAAPLPARTAMMLLAAGAFLAYAFLPWDLRRIRIVYPRFATLTCLLAALAIPLGRGECPRALRLVSVLCVGWSIFLVVQFRRMDETVGDLDALAAVMDRNSCVVGLDTYFDNEVVRGNMAHSHHAEYLALLTDSLPGFTFASTPQSPLALRTPDGERAQTARQAALPLFLNRALKGANSSDGMDFYRYFLVPKHLSPARAFGSREDQVRVAGTSGPYVLYVNPAGSCGRTTLTSR